VELFFKYWIQTMCGAKPQATPIPDRTSRGLMKLFL